MDVRPSVYHEHTHKQLVAAMNTAFDALAVIAAEGAAPEEVPKTRSAQWRAEMRARIVIKVSGGTIDLTAKKPLPKFSMHVRAGDTEPFTVNRSPAQLKKLLDHAQAAYGAKLALPAFPAIGAPKELDPTFMEATGALLGLKPLLQR